MSDSASAVQFDVVVVICAYGRDSLTLQTLRDLGHSSIGHMVCVVDNQGSFAAPECDAIRVIRPSANLGWARGSNLGLRSMISGTDASAFVLLNNDVRLSPGFIDGLYDAWLHTGAAVIGPAYDHNWPHQRIRYSGQPCDYRSSPVERLVPFVDGTCMMISREVVNAVGYLDHRYWPEWGWGCDKDFCLRVRSNVGSVFVTERCYLSHHARGTVAHMPAFTEAKAEAENDAGMAAKWGPEWCDLLYEGFDYCDRVGLVQKNLGG